MLVLEGGFDATFSIINLKKKLLISLKAKVNVSNVAILVDIKFTNSFTTRQCTKILELKI